MGRARKRQAKSRAYKYQKARKSNFALMRNPLTGITNKQGGPMPVIHRAQLVYSAKIDVTLASGSGSYVMSCNGLYDPDITGTGTQPLYFDQLMSMYNYYTVVKSYIEWHPMNSTSSRDMIATTFIDDDNSVTGFAAGNAQRPGAQVATFNTNHNSVGPLTQGWNLRKNFGKVGVGSSLFRGNQSANPSEQQYYVLMLTDIGLSSGDYPMLVRVVYTVEFSEPKTLAFS